MPQNTGGRIGSTLGGLGQLGSSADLYKMPSAGYGRQNQGPQQTQPQQQQNPQNPVAPTKSIFEQILSMIMNRKPWWNDPKSPDIFRQTPSNPTAGAGNPIGPSTPPVPQMGQQSPLGGDIGGMYGRSPMQGGPSNLPPWIQTLG